VTSDSSPTLQEWRKLYEAAIQIKQLAPWEWMSEDMLFGVQDPETGELGFVSIMGALGEHFAAAVYIGAKGLQGFWLAHSGNENPFIPPEVILETYHLQASFEGRNMLRKDDRDIIKQLGLKFRGRNEWPMFRSYRPGFVPWYLDPWEAHFLAFALEQSLDVIGRLQDNLSLLEPPDESSYLVRVPHVQKGSLAWQDQIVRVPLPEQPTIQLEMDIELLESVKNAGRGQHELEVDLFLLPGGFRDRPGRPYFAYMLLTVEAGSGFVLGSELLTVETTLEDMWGQVPLRALKQMARYGAIPRQVTVRTTILWQLMQPLAEELGFRVELAAPLPSLDEVKSFLLDRFT
jgi:hypothetical protein